jgi:predicted DCC family thiol-disulfide oxidoreductase YuxK
VAAQVVEAVIVGPRTPLPILVFDGDCGFCTTCARFLARWVVRGRPASVMPWQALDLAGLGLTCDQCQVAAQWVGQDGQLASGHAAIAAALKGGRSPWRPVGALLVAPGFSWISARLYSWVANHRYALPGGTPACRIEGTGEAS